MSLDVSFKFFNIAIYLKLPQFHLQNVEDGSEWKEKNKDKVEIIDFVVDTVEGGKRGTEIQVSSVFIFYKEGKIIKDF